MDRDQMPILSPIPIPTKGLPWWKRFWVWRFTSRRWVLEERWYYNMPDDDRLPEALQGKRVYVEKGFEFDGASIPKLFRFFLEPTGLLLLGGLLHDCIYQRTHLMVDTEEISLTRAEADVVFWRVNLHVNGVVSAAYASYYMVRLFGWAAWNKHRKSARNG